MHEALGPVSILGVVANTYDPSVQEVEADQKIKVIFSWREF